MQDSQLTYTDSGVTDWLTHSSHGLRVSESYVPMLPPADNATTEPDQPAEP